jgi:hypothetical protein
VTRLASSVPALEHITPQLDPTGLAHSAISHTIGVDTIMGIEGNIFGDFK